MAQEITPVADSNTGGQSGTPKPSDALRPGYGRARLWLGITAVGTIVSASALALGFGLPRVAAASFEPTLAGQILFLTWFFALYAVIHLPFDVMGGYLLPRRFGRPHPSAAGYAAGLLRGMIMHTLVLALIGLAILLAARAFGIGGAIGVGILASLALLAVRGPLSQSMAALRRAAVPCEPIDLRQTTLRAGFISSDDQGFTGGIEGVFRPRSIIIPARWATLLGSAGLEVVRRRQQFAVLTGSWFRGRVLAVCFTWGGIALAAVLVGRGGIGTAQGVVEMSLVFTLWSFLGLLVLPTLSRAGVAEVDGAVRKSGIAERLLVETIRKLDTLQDAETQRPAAIELIFHPVPSVQNRVDGLSGANGTGEPSGPGGQSARGFHGAARSAVYLSAAGLGLLGRAVHCNCGRPALWVFLPSD